MEKVSGSQKLPCLLQALILLVIPALLKYLNPLIGDDTLWGWPCLFQALAFYLVLRNFGGNPALFRHLHFS